MRTSRWVVSCFSMVCCMAFAEPVAKTSAASEAPRHVTLDFHGPLRDALKQIASQGGLNLVATGGLDEPAQVILKDVSAEDALDIVASSYHLKVTHKGSIWTLRPMTDDEKESAEDEEKSNSDDDEKDAHDEEHAATAPVAPIPPLPPMPPSNFNDPESLRQELQQRLHDRLSEKFRHKFERGSHSHGNDLVGAGSLTVDEGQNVDNVVSYGGGVTVLGHVEHDCVAFGGPVHLGKDSVVEGDVLAFGGPVEREDGSEVQGDVVAFGGAAAGKVMGSILKDNLKHGAKVDVDRSGSPGSGSGFPGFLAKFAVLFGLGFLATMFVPNRMKMLEAEILRDPLKCGVTGLLGAIALVPLTPLLIITIIGIPIALVMWVMVPLGITMGLAVVATEIGLRLPLRNLRKTQAMVLAVGLLILLVVDLIPVLGPLTLCLVGLLSFGAVIRTRFGSRRQGIPEPV